MSTGKGALYSLCISHYIILLSYRHVFVKLNWNLYYVYIVHYRYLLLNEFVLDSYKAKLFLIYSLNFSHGNDATSLIRQSKMSLISKRNFIVFLMHACVKYFNYIFITSCIKAYDVRISFMIFILITKEQLLNGTPVCKMPHFPLHDMSASLWGKKTFSFAINFAISCCIINCSHLMAYNNHLSLFLQIL